MGKIKEIIGILLKSNAKNNVKRDLTDEDREKARDILALKKQLRLLEDINIQYEETIRGQLKTIAQHKEGNMQERLIDLASQIFMPSPSVVSPQTSLKTHFKPENSRDFETGKEYTDEQLKSVLGNLTKPQLKQVNELTKNQQLNLIKQKIPDISDTSAYRMIEIAKELI